MPLGILGRERSMCKVKEVQNGAVSVGDSSENEFSAEKEAEEVARATSGPWLYL